MLVFHEIKSPLTASIEAAKAILEVGEASEKSIGVVIVLLESTIAALKEISRIPVPGTGRGPEHRGREIPSREMTPATFTPLKETVEKRVIKKTELLKMGVRQSTIREWLDTGKLKKVGKFGPYFYDSELKNRIDNHLAANKGRMGIVTDPAPQLIRRSELIMKGVAESTIGYWLTSGKLRSTGIRGEYVFDGSVEKLTANYKRRSGGVEVSEEEARREGKISRKAIIKRGVKGGTIGYWIKTGKLHKSDEKGYYLYDESARRLLENYRPRRTH